MAQYESGLARTGNTPEKIDRAQAVGAELRRCGASFRSERKSVGIARNHRDEDAINFKNKMAETITNDHHDRSD